MAMIKMSVTETADFGLFQVAILTTPFRCISVSFKKIYFLLTIRLTIQCEDYEPCNL